jgi:hypothetical protein
MLKRPDDKPEPEVSFHGYCIRGEAMLDIRIDGKTSYTLGPFDNKEQRCVIVAKLRDALRIKAAPRDRR